MIQRSKETAYNIPAAGYDNEATLLIPLCIGFTTPDSLCTCSKNGLHLQSTFFNSFPFGPLPESFPHYSTHLAYKMFCILEPVYQSSFPIPGFGVGLPF